MKKLTTILVLLLISVSGQAKKQQVINIDECRTQYTVA